ncbi:MAG: hypothetical protein ACFFCZ_10545 [Promethearchaeota archaeon]
MTALLSEIKRLYFDLEEFPVSIRLETSIETDWNLVGGITIPATPKGRNLQLPLYLAEILVFQGKATWAEREPYSSVLELYEWIWGEENKRGIQNVVDNVHLRIKRKLELIERGELLKNASEKFINTEKAKLETGLKRLSEKRVSKLLRRVQETNREGEQYLTASEKLLLFRIRKIVNNWSKALMTKEQNLDEKSL